MLSCSHREQGRYPIPPPAAARAFARSITLCPLLLHASSSFPLPGEFPLDRTGESGAGARRGAVACFPRAIKILSVNAEEYPQEGELNGKGR